MEDKQKDLEKQVEDLQKTNQHLITVINDLQALSKAQMSVYRELAEAMRPRGDK